MILGCTALPQAVQLSDMATMRCDVLRSGRSMRPGLGQGGCSADAYSVVWPAETNQATKKVI